MYDFFKKSYYYSYSLVQISYIFLYRLLYNNYKEHRPAIKNKDYISNIPALFNDCTYIIDNIYLGSIYNACNENLIKELNIKRIINITIDSPNFCDSIEYYNYKIKDDGKDEFSLEKLEEMCNFIKKNNNNILVHCMFGKSRSCTLVLFYLMKYHNMNLDEAFKFVENKRYVINPSIAFYNYLKDIEINLNKL